VRVCVCVCVCVCVVQAGEGSSMRRDAQMLMRMGEPMPLCGLSGALRLSHQPHNTEQHSAFVVSVALSLSRPVNATLAIDL
jgi:hypothetical protein